METKTVLDKLQELNTSAELADLALHCAAFGDDLLLSEDTKERNLGWILVELALDLERMAKEAGRDDPPCENCHSKEHGASECPYGDGDAPRLAETIEAQP